MATVKYGALELIPAPEIGISLQSKFFGADIRFSRSQTYSLKGTLLSNQLSGASGIFTLQNQIVTGFQQDYLPFTIDGTIIGYPQVKSMSFDNGALVQKEGYSIELEFLDSGNPFQITGTYYGFTGVTGLFHNVESINETLSYTTDFKTFNYTHNVDVQYRTGQSIDPLLNAKIIASGLINNKIAFPFVTTGGMFGNKTYAEKEAAFDGSYSVTETFEGSTGNVPFDHLFSLSFQLAENGVTSVSQQGTVKGYDPNKYANAKSGYGVIKNDIYANCTGFYARYLTGTLNPVYLSDTRTDDINNGTIQYSRNFSDESGISDVRWQYQHQTTLENNSITTTENGTINGLGHVSERFFQASGFFATIQPGLTNRVLSHISGFGFTGDMSVVSREQTFNRFEGTIAYNYGFSNNPGVGAGSGIHDFTVNVTDDLPVHNTASFNVVSQRVIVQSLESTSQGQRNVSVNIQGNRETPIQTLLDFARDKCNQYSPTGAQFLDPFINDIGITYNQTESNVQGNVTYIYGGLKTRTDLKI